MSNNSEQNAKDEAKDEGNNIESEILTREEEPTLNKKE